MLSDKPEEQTTLFKEMLIRKMTVREAEQLGRKVAQDKVRKQEYIKDPNILEIENNLGEKLGTRVHVEKRDVGGVIKIDFFSYDDLETIAAYIQKADISESVRSKLAHKLERVMKTVSASKAPTEESVSISASKEISEVKDSDLEQVNNSLAGLQVETNEKSDRLVDDRGTTEAHKDLTSEDDDLYNIKNFTI
jgi:hypothetical protein